MRTILRLTGWLAVAALLGACAATGKTPVEAGNSTGAEMMAAAEAQPPRAYHFYPGDELTVTAVRRPELSVTARVDPYGFISYPYLGQVYVRNMSPAELAEHLARGLEEGGYYTRTVLTVSLVSSKDQYVYVLGEVKKPGPVSIVGSSTLLSAIGAAGGQTHDAEMSTVLWIRGSQSPPGVVKVDLRALGDPRRGDQRIPTLTMIPGDVLYIPDTVIASVERFMKRIFAILQPVVELGQGVLLYDQINETIFQGNRGGQSTTTIILR